VQGTGPAEISKFVSIGLAWLSQRWALRCRSWELAGQVLCI
jgi:hypothetical protein